MSFPNLGNLTREELKEALGNDELVSKLLRKAAAKGGRANHAGVESNAPPDKPSRRVDVLDIEDVASKVGAGGVVAVCRCYKSASFPLCDGTHVKHNEETGDNVAPAVIKSGLPPEKRGCEFRAEISEEELLKAVTGARANNYGVKSNAPPENPTKRADMLDVEDMKKLVDEKGVVALCRCFRSSTFPLCDGSHNKHNEETGDNAGPLLLKRLPKEGDGNDAKKPSDGAGDIDGLRAISMSEVAKHNTEGDMWVAIHGKVYDVSQFLPKHPGGKSVFMPYAGKNADEGFDPIHPESIIDDHKDDVKLLGRVPESELQKEGGKAEEQAVERPPIEEVLSLYDMEEVARRVMRKTAWGYYTTGERDEYTKTGNVLAFRQVKLVPRVMVDVSNVSTATTILGFKSSMPLYISAAAKGGLSMCQDAEVALARAAHKFGIIQMAPHLGTKTLREIAEARQGDQVQFLQLYTEKDRKAAEETIKLATQLGYKALFVTVDSAGIGKRETDLRYTPGGSAPRSKSWVPLCRDCSAGLPET
uniref:Mitochondrial cytochrome n=1 Tax=Tetraselmis sp. GSL018 TaxID=582737 RepID=A0A061S3A4_9CHLO